MGKLDADYLWLHERPRRSPRLSRLSLLLVVPIVAGVAWYAFAGHGDSSRIAPNSDISLTRIPLDARIHVAGVHEVGTDPQHYDFFDTVRDDVAGQPAISVDSTQPREYRPASVQSAGAGQPLANGWQRVAIEPDDTLSIAFNRHDLSYIDSLKIAHMPTYGNRFTRGLKQGDILRVRADADGAVQAVEFPLDALHTLEVHRRGDDFIGQVVLQNVERRRAYASGVIRSSFYADALAAGLSDRQVLQLNHIFGWDIDFGQDIRPGDRFVVVYDELYRDGEKIANGHILAAAFVNHGHEVRAVRYTAAGGKARYYTPGGRPMKKAFTRAPVDYTRISSSFSMDRYHPILHRIRRHEGTDYAAPKGTPIRATGDGIIIFRGRRGGYGNMVIIRHDAHVTMRFGHMSAFASGQHTGSHVTQGDVIGYVGMTGLATGPHVHYEFRVDGKPEDPQTAPLPGVQPLSKRYFADFRRRSAPLLAQLDTLTHTSVAQASVSNQTHTE